MSNLAETILRNVPKDALAKIVYDAMRFERQNDTPDWADGGNSCAQAEARHTAAKVQDAVLATLTAAMDPALSERAGEVLPRLRKADEYEPLGHDGWEAADLITALLAQNAALRADRDEYADAFKADNAALGAALLRAEAAEAERDALRAERDDALTFLDNAVSKAPEPLKALGKYLAGRLDEDEWPTAEQYLNAAAKACADRAEAAEAQIAALTARVEGLTGAATKAERIIANGQPDKIADAGAILRATLSATTEASHVNETPKSEHDAGNVLTAAQARDAALWGAWNVVWEAKTLLDAKNALHALISEART